MRVVKDVGDDGDEVVVLVVEKKVRNFGRKGRRKCSWGTGGAGGLCRPFRLCCRFRPLFIVLHGVESLVLTMRRGIEQIQCLAYPFN